MKEPVPASPPRSYHTSFQANRSQAHGILLVSLISSPVLSKSVLIYSTERMKQKVVIRLQMEDSKKRSKALKVAVGLPGVLSAAIEGADKNQIVVIGEGVDSVSLTKLLRKNMGFAEIISVSAVEEKKEEKKEDKKPDATVQPVVVWPSYPSQYYYMQEAPDHYQDPSCCIM